MTHAEIAEELGTTREAVKHLELSALRKVRKALGIEAGSRERIKGVFHGRRQRCTKA
jgi:DNA-directed RNA polymerase sigma subunit (sigma70/sigma32)